MHIIVNTAQNTSKRLCAVMLAIQTYAKINFIKSYKTSKSKNFTYKKEKTDNLLLHYL